MAIADYDLRAVKPFARDEEPTSANEWQPIETAPRDKAVLLFGDGKFEVAIWFFGDWGTAGSVLGDRIGFHPAHWMPLPEPPSA